MKSDCEREDADYRNRLIQRVDLGMTCKCTLIHAPPGFGKTTLLNDWIALSTAEVALVNYDETNPGAAALLASIEEAVYPLVPEQDLADSNTEEGLEDRLISIINSLSTSSAEIALVLDNYHPNPDTDQILAFLLEYQPPQLHLFIIGESPPPISSVPRLRVRRQLNEITAADLKLSNEEAASLFLAKLGIELVRDDIAALLRLTSGRMDELQRTIRKLGASDNPACQIRKLIDSNANAV